MPGVAAAAHDAIEEGGLRHAADTWRSDSTSRPVTTCSGMHSRVGVQQRAKTLHHQPRADEQHHGERDFRDDEHAARRRRPAAASRPTRPPSSRRRDWAATRRAPATRRTRSSSPSRGARVKTSTRASSRGGDIGQRRGQRGRERCDAERARRAPRRCPPAAAKQQALDDQLAKHALARRAEHDAHRELALARPMHARAEIRHIRAGDEQQQRRARHEHEQRRARSPTSDAEAAARASRPACRRVDRSRKRRRARRRR